MNLEQKAAEGVAWSAIQRVSSQVLSLLVILVLSRLLEPDAFGLVAIANVIIIFAQTFLDLGFTQAIVQRDKLEDEHLDTAFWTSVFISIILTIVGIGSANLMARLFRNPELASVLRWFVLSLFFIGLSSTQQALLQRGLAFRILAMRSLIAELVGGVFGITLAYLGWDVWSLVAQALIRLFVGMIVLWVSSDWRPGFRVTFTDFRGLYRFGINVVGDRLVNFFKGRTDEILIGYFLGASALGFYTIGYRTLRVMTRLFTESIDAVAFPTFSRLQVDRERLREAFHQVTQITSMIAFPSFLGVALIAPELVTVFFGEKWAPSIPVMQILAFIGILHSTTYFNATVLLSIGKPFLLFGINFINAFVNMIALLIAVRWGIVAVAIVYVLRGYLLAPLSISLLHRVIDLNVRKYLLQYLPALIGSFIMGVSVLGMRTLLEGRVTLGINMIILVMTGVLIYVVSVWLVFPVSIFQSLKLIRRAFPGWFPRRT